MEKIRVRKIKLNRNQEELEELLNELITTPERVITASVFVDEMGVTHEPVLVVIYSEYVSS